MRCDATDIDFARFLGNVETFAGINRDRAPFVFTPEFAYIMGGKGSEHYNQFSSLCCRAFNILRRHSGLFVNLLNLVCGTFTKSLTPPPPPRCSLARSLAHSLLMQMLSTGLPELHDREDIRYLEEKFMPQLSDDEAAARFVKLISKALNTTTTRVNNAIHILAGEMRL